MYPGKILTPLEYPKVSGWTANSWRPEREIWEGVFRLSAYLALISLLPQMSVWRERRRPRKGPPAVSAESPLFAWEWRGNGGELMSWWNREAVNLGHIRGPLRIPILIRLIVRRRPCR